MPKIKSVAELGVRLEDLNHLKRAEDSSNKAARTLMGLSPETKALLDSGMSLAEALKATCAKIPAAQFGSSGKPVHSITFGQSAPPSNPFYTQMWTQEKAILEECLRHASDANFAANGLSPEAQRMLKESSYASLVNQWNEDIFVYMRNPGASSSSSPTSAAPEPFAFFGASKGQAAASRDKDKSPSSPATMQEMLADLNVLPQLRGFTSRFRDGGMPDVFPPDGGYTTLTQIVADLQTLQDRNESFSEEEYARKVLSVWKTMPEQQCKDAARHIKENLPLVLVTASRSLAEKLLQLSPEARRLVQADKVPFQEVEARWDAALQEFVGLGSGFV